MCFTVFVTAMTLLKKKTEDVSHFLLGNVYTLPLEGFVSGSIAGCVGRALVIPLDSKGTSPMAMMVRGKTAQMANVSVLYRYTPYWGIRMAVYTHSMEYYGGMFHDKHPLVMAPYFFLTGVWTECWARAILNPVNKARYTRDLMHEAGDKSASLVSAVKSTWSKNGAMGLFQDVAKYRVEAPKVGIFFMVYNSLRNTILGAVVGKPADASMEMKAPVDFVCGGLAGAAAVAGTHGLRQSSYDSASPYAARCMGTAIAMEAPLAAVAMCLYGLLMASVYPPEKDANLSGWPEVAEEISQYGGHKNRHLELIG